MKKKMSSLSLLVLCAALAVCLCGCGSQKAPEKVDADSIVYDGTTISWTASSGAESYLIDIDSLGESEVAAPRKGFTAPKANEQLTVSIKAKNANGTSDAVIKTFSRLKTINADDLHFDENGKMTWDAVEDALGYVVRYGDEEKAVDAPEFDEFKRGAALEIKVRATSGKNRFSQFGTSVKKTFLSAPTNVKYNNDSGQLSWTGSGFGSEYEIYIGPDTSSIIESPIAKVQTNAYKFDAQGQSFAVAIRAIGNGKDTYSSPVGTPEMFRMLDVVRDLHVEAGHVVWEEIDGATGYLVTLNGAQQTVTDCNVAIPAGIPTTVRVKPIATGENFFSDWSVSKTVTVLSAPTLLWNSDIAIEGDISQAALYWNRVNLTGVGGYRVKVCTETNPEGTVISRNTDQTFYGDSYNATGVYKIYVMTVAAADSDACDSDWSQPFTVERLPAPSAYSNAFITSTPDDLSKGFSVSYTRVMGARGYQLSTGGNWGSVSNALTMTVTDILAPGEAENGKSVAYKIRSVGSTEMISIAKTVTLDSVEALEFNITVLPAPANPDFAGDYFTWESVANAYEGRYSVKMGQMVAGVESGTSYSIANVSAGEYDVSVCARGDGARLLPSAYSNAKRLYKLAAPTEVKFNTTINEGTLSVTEVPYAKSYKVVTGNGSISGDNPDTNAVTAANLFVGVDSVYLRVYSVANYWNDNHTVYYASSQLPAEAQSFTKLRAPTWGTPFFEGTTLLWNGPSNFTQDSQAGISYNITDDQGIARVDGTGLRTRSLNIAGYDAGLYTFKIKAIGDGTHFVNSDYSDVQSVTKLETPQLQREADSDAYTWNGVTGAQNYVITIAGNANTVDHTGAGNKHSFVPHFENATVYSVSLIAAGNGTTTMNSKAYELTQNVKRIGRLGREDFTVTYSKSEVASDGYFTVTVQNPLAAAKGYTYRFNKTTPTGLEIGENELTCRYGTSTPNKYDVTVVCKASYFDADGNYCLDGDDSDVRTITLLNAVSNVIPDGEGTVNWTSAGSVSNGYVVTITYADDTTETVTVKSNMLSASEYNENKKTIKSIEVRTKGDGTSTITSKAATWERG